MTFTPACSSMARILASSLAARLRLAGTCSSMYGLMAKVSLKYSAPDIRTVLFINILASITENSPWGVRMKKPDPLYCPLGQKTAMVSGSGCTVEDEGGNDPTVESFPVA